MEIKITDAMIGTDAGEVLIRTPEHDIVLSPLVIGKLLPMLIAAQGHQSAQSPTVRTMSVQPFQVGATAGLAFHIAPGTAIHFEIPPEALPGLRKTVAELDLLMATPGGAA